MLAPSTSTPLSEARPQSMIFVSGNPDKQRDALTCLSSAVSIPMELKDIDLKEIQGSEDEIARDKCQLAMRMFEENQIIIVEDTCKLLLIYSFDYDCSFSALRFDQFAGMPGPYIKHFNKAIGAQGLYQMLQCYENKGATVRSTVAIGIPKSMTNDGKRKILIVSVSLDYCYGDVEFNQLLATSDVEHQLSSYTLYIYSNMVPFSERFLW